MTKRSFATSFLAKLHAQWRRTSAHTTVSPSCSQGFGYGQVSLLSSEQFGHIISVDSVQAEEDEIAIAMATSLLREQHPTSAAMEVWKQKRCLGRSQNNAPDASTLRSPLLVKSS